MMRYITFALFILISLSGYSQKRITIADSLQLGNSGGASRVGSISPNVALGTNDKAIPTQKAVKTYVDSAFIKNPLRNSGGSGDSLLTKKGIDGIIKRIDVTGAGVTPTITDTTVTYDISASAVITGTRIVAPTSVPGPFQLTGPQSAFLPNSNAVIVEKFFLPYRIVVNTVGAGVTVAAASSTISVGVYSDAGSLLINSGPIASTSTGLKTTGVTSTVLVPGFYWCAYSSNSTAVKVAGFSVHGYTGIDQDIAIYGISSNSASSGNLPSTIGTLTDYTAEGAFILLKN